jgi:hypothetical protein
MESASPAVLSRPLILQDRHASAWTRTVAVIRIPRFSVSELIARKAPRMPDPAFAEATAGKDPLAAFATEQELEAAARSRCS